MKITHCIFTMRTGGAQMLVVDILNRLANNHNLSLIIINDEFEESIVSKLHKDIKVFYLNRKQGSKSIIPVVELNWLLFKISPDVIHCHEVNMINFIYIKRPKTILTVHNVGYPKLEQSKFGRLIAISENVAEDVKRRFNITIPIVQNGIDFKKFNKKTDYSLKGSFKLIQISRLLHEAKGQDVLVEALNLLVHKYNIKNISLDFVGEGPSLEMLRQLIVDKKLESHVNFLGNQNRDWIKCNISDYNILVQPSRFEGFGLTIIEGVASGIPVVASNIDGPAEIFQSIETKFLFKSENFNDCALKIKDVISLYDESSIENYMSKIYEILSSKYSIDATVEGYVTEYKKV